MAKLTDFLTNTEAAIGAEVEQELAMEEKKIKIEAKKNKARALVTEVSLNFDAVLALSDKRSDTLMKVYSRPIQCITEATDEQACKAMENEAIKQSQEFTARYN